MTQRLIYIITLILLFSLSSCTGRSSNSNYNDTKDDYTYVDGNYYAEVKYYNPKTGTRSTYTLKVKIKEDKLITIYWTNGGWLDDSHFTPPDTLWDIDFESKNEEMTTEIDIPKLIDFFEGIYQLLVEEVEQNKLEIALEKGIKELKSRFTIIA